MPRTQLPLTGGFYKSRSLPISAQECTNLYVHMNEGGGLANESLFGTPGADQLATSGGVLEVNRGSHVMAGISYHVNGGTLYRLTRTISGAGVESFVLTSLGAISGTERVSMADNGTQLFILDPGGEGFIFVEPATVTKITDADFTANGAPQHVIYIDGFFLLTTDSKKFIISALNDGLTYNALDFGSAEADPDDIVAPLVVNNQLYIAGEETLEPFRNAAATTGAGFPFIRVEGGVISTGVQAAFSIVNVSLIEGGSTFFFIGGDANDEPRVFNFIGGGVAVVSDDGIDNLLEELTDTQLSNVFAWTYSQGGETFVGFGLPTTAVVFGIKSRKWHERKSFDIIDDVSSEFRYRVNSVVKAYGRILVGDSIDGRVGALNLDDFDEYGQNILSVVSTIPFSNVGESITFPEIEMTCESGVGNDVDLDPMVSMDRSVDGGKTFTPRRERRLGKKGENKKRQIWRRNGRAARFELFRFSISAKVKKVFIKLEADVE